MPSGSRALLAVCHDDAGEADAFLVFHGIPNDDEGFGGHLAVRRDVIRLVEVAFVDFCERHEAVDVNRMCAFEVDLFETTWRRTGYFLQVLIM